MELSQVPPRTINMAMPTAIAITINTIMVMATVMAINILTIMAMATVTILTMETIHPKNLKVST